MLDEESSRGIIWNYRRTKVGQRYTNYFSNYRAIISDEFVCEEFGEFELVGWEHRIGFIIGIEWLSEVSDLSFQSNAVNAEYHYIEVFFFLIYAMMMKFRFKCYSIAKIRIDE